MLSRNRFSVLTKMNIKKMNCFVMVPPDSWNRSLTSLVVGSGGFLNFC